MMACLNDCDEMCVASVFTEIWLTIRDGTKTPL